MSRDWYKVRRAWRDSPSHRSLSGDALALGPSTLFYLADPNWDPGQTEAALLDAGDGHPLTAKEIAAEARWPVARVRKALADLVRVGTLEERDGVWVFPRYGLHQETPAAKRMRVKREEDERKKREANRSEPERNSDANSDLSTSTSTSGERVDLGGGAGGRVAPPLTAPQIWEFLVPTLTEITPRPWDFGLTPPPGIGELISDGWTAERIRDRCVAIAEACRDGRIDPRWWRWQMFELKHWRILADQLHPPAHTAGHYKHTGTEEYAGGDVEL